jgi:hypothetical protein
MEPGLRQQGGQASLWMDHDGIIDYGPGKNAGRCRRHARQRGCTSAAMFVSVCFLKIFFAMDIDSV